MDSPAAIVVDPALVPEVLLPEDPMALADQLKRLDRLADLGIEIIEALADQAKGRGPRVVEGDLCIALERVSRAVRLALMLRARLVQDAAKARSAAAAAAAAAGPGPEKEDQARKDKVVRIVRRVAQQDARVAQHAYSVGSLVKERLEHDEIYGKVMTWTVSDLVAAICQDLGLNPDWARLAAEAWAQDEIGSGQVGKPLQALLDEEPESAVAPAGGGGEGMPEAPPPIPIPTFDDKLQSLAEEARSVLAARPSG